MKNFFFSSKNNLDELVFENRNKLYGAYVLRNEQAGILQKSLLIGIGFFAMVSVAPLIFSTSNKDTVICRLPAPISLQTINEPEPIVKPIIKTLPASTQKTTEKSVLPEPTSHPRQEITRDTKTTPASGVATANTDSGHTTTQPQQQTYTQPTDTATHKIPAKQAVTKPIDNKPHDKVDISANFIGGIDNFRKNIQQNFDLNEFEGYGESLQTKITFIVEKDGTITNIKATGPNKDFNLEAEKAVRSIRGKWTPAKLDGNLVRSYFSVPLIMNFE